MKNIKGFTLVELIVALTILVIIGGIGYLKYFDFISGSKDASRYAVLNEISNLIKSYEINKTLPAPIDFVEVRALGKTIGYQGYAGPDVLEKIHYSEGGKDPSDKKYFNYYISSDRKSFQLMGFYEEEASLKISGIFSKTYAGNIDYEYRYPIVVGDKLGILTNEKNKPIQEIDSVFLNGYIDLSGLDKDDRFKAYMTTDRIYTDSGSILATKLFSISDKSKYKAPRDCPEGYISVWGDIDFNQEGFCVAKYEMTFSEFDSPGIPNNSSDYNTYNYIPGKRYVSRIDYPVTRLSQEQAIEACKKIGKGYHLITNNEWMTIARQIEYESINWRSNNPGYEDTLFKGNNGVATNAGCKDNTGPNSKITKSGDGDINCFHKRKQVLFNGEIIWDFAGNVSEFVNKANTKSGSGFNVGKTSFGLSNNNWKEFRNLSEDNIIKYGPLVTEDGSNGVGGVFDMNGIDDNVFVRGGSYNDDYMSGIYTISLDMKGDWYSDNIGFRCAR